MRKQIILIGCALLAVLIAMPQVLAEDGEGGPDIEGSVELLYRSVSRDGSVRKYDEDFDGLDSGLRLSGLELDWYGIDSSMIDFLKLDASGLGGDPYERSSLRLGRKGWYDLRITNSKQSYLYNLFQLEDDEDASSWNSDRSLAEVNLTVHATRTVDFFLELQEVDRSGTSFFMKDINQDLFRLETPLDQNIRRYSVGSRFRIGAADFLFRQTLSRYDSNFNNSTTDNNGLTMFDLATLEQYDWVQHDQGDTDLTTLTFSMPIGERFHVKATAFGTLLGKQEIDSQVSLDATGTSYLGTCTVTGATCSNASPCDAGIPGNVCIANPYAVSGGSSTAALEADYLALGGDLSVMISEPLDFHLQIETLSREITGVADRDLDGNGVPDDTEGSINDATPGSMTSVDYTLNTVTGLFVYEPTGKVRLRAGYRTIQRDLKRSGFEYGTTEYRNTDYDSGSDDTIILGVVLKPVSWFDFDAGYERGDLSQAFTALSAAETDRLRIRAGFRLGEATKFDLGYTAYSNSNTGFDFRRPGDCGAGDDVDSGCWDSRAEGTTTSIAVWHKPSQEFDFWVRYSRHDIDRVTRTHFNLDGFFNTDVGNSVYNNDNTEFSAQVNYSWAKRWKAFLRGTFNESDGDNAITGSTYSSSLMILQDYSDLEGGLTYSFPKDYYVGARFRSFDYDDHNDALDYSGDILSVIAGYRF